ncbi:hypothetical protein COCOBI_11-2350 [Coccomyxa sp. Obi]|nr:hypothetical protein COCOBI_11-2350 [Coccomyxa sp. Obi]
MRTTPWTLPLLEAAKDLGREGANGAVMEPDQPASGGGEAVGGEGGSAEAAEKVRDPQQHRSRRAAASAGVQLTPVVVSSAVSDSDMSVDIVNVSTDCSTPGVSSSSQGASIGDELVSKLATDSKGVADADKLDRDAHLLIKRNQSNWRRMEEEMRALKRRNRELEKELEQCKVKLKEVDIAQHMVDLSGA